MADLWLAPYLPLAGSLDIGPWRFVAFDEFTEAHAESAELFDKCQRLITAYRVPNAPPRVGAAVLPLDGRVGDELDRGQLAPLRLALIAALIDQNPSPATDGNDDENPNAGLAVTTTENAQVFGRPLTDGNHYVISVGGMTERLDWRTAPEGELLPPVEPPIALLLPLMRGAVDDEYVTALYETLSGDDAGGQRLARCIRWQGVAWSNEQVVDEDTRILAFRSAFEVLLGSNSMTRQIGTALSTLLDDPGPAVARRWTEPSGQKEMMLTETEWWFQSMTLLRNSIAHGDETSTEDRTFHDGVAHLWHADSYLRRAIKRTVIEAGHSPDLDQPPSRRALRRAFREFAREQSSSDDQSD